MKTNNTLITLTFLILLHGAWAQEMQVHFINVGQGSATLLEFPCGAALIDTGGENNEQFRSTEALTAYLDQFFNRRTDLNKTIQLLVITHPHIDHTLGIRDVIQNYKVKNVITNGQEFGSGRYQQAWLHAHIASAEATAATTDDIGYHEAILTNIPPTGLTNAIIDPINCSGADPSIKLLWGRVPTDPGWGKNRYGKLNFDNNNNHSVVIRVDFGEASLLLTGDLETEAIHDLLTKYQGTTTLDTDVYLAGHHGSRNGSTLELIEAVTPEMAVISFGDPDREAYWTAWKYGHPNISIVTMLESNCTSLRTPKDVLVGNGPENFNYHTITKAIYGTGWDGNITLQATWAGAWSYLDPNALAKININTASPQQLATLPSIGPVKAQAIVTYRQRNGNFSSIEDIVNVTGIGPATLARIRQRVTI
jgi:competence protein ComEC